MIYEELKKLSDEELTLLSQKGDRNAEEVLLQRYKEKVRVRARLYYMLGGDSDDIVQEGMIGLFSAIHSFDSAGGAAFSSFAELCVNRRIIDAIKTANRQKHAPLNNSVSFDVPQEGGADGQTLADTLVSGPETDPEASYVLRETVSLMLSEGSKLLSPMEHQVLELLIGGADTEEIALKLGKSTKSVGNAVTRIRGKIHQFQFT